MSALMELYSGIIVGADLVSARIELNGGIIVGSDLVSTRMELNGDTNVGTDLVSARVELYSETIVGADLVSARMELYSIIIVGADLVSARMELNSACQMIERILFRNRFIFNEIVSIHYIIMPNNFHCILSIQRDTEQAETRSAPTAASAPVTVCRIVQVFKSKTTVEYIRGYL